MFIGSLNSCYNVLMFCICISLQMLQTTALRFVLYSCMACSTHLCFQFTSLCNIFIDSKIQWNPVSSVEPSVFLCENGSVNYKRDEKYFYQIWNFCELPFGTYEPERDRQTDGRLHSV